MQVEYHQTVEVSGKASIGVEDITAALCDYQAMAEENYDPLENERSRQFAVTELINAAIQSLKAVTDEMAGDLHERVRKQVHDHLTEQAARYGDSQQ